MVINASSSTARFRARASLALALSLPACSSATAFPPLGDGPIADPTVCVDLDGDGYGPACPLGEDCDDERADVAEECYADCEEPAPGCDCDADGERLYCPYVVSKVLDQKVCGPGYATCEGGVWSACILNYTAVPPA